MEGETPIEDEGADLPPPIPKRVRNQRMVTVYNDSKRGQKIYLGHGKGSIPPGATGRIPYGVYKKLEHLTWVQKADRGDVPK